MAQKDYVSRAKKGGPSKKPSGNKRKPVKAAKGSPAMLALLVAIIAAFIAALYFLKTNKLPLPPPTPRPSANVRPSNHNAIPPAPSPRWDYVDALTNPDAKIATDGTNKEAPTGMSQEQQRILSMMAADRPQNSNGTSATYNQQVGRNSQNDRKPAAADVAPSAPAAAQSWMLQCGSFKNKAGAESIKAQLAMAGFTSQIIFSNSLHRVMVGPYKTKEAANKMRTQLNNAGVRGCNIRG